MKYLYGILILLLSITRIYSQNYSGKSSDGDYICKIKIGTDSVLRFEYYKVNKTCFGIYEGRINKVKGNIYACHTIMKFGVFPLMNQNSDTSCCAINAELVEKIDSVIVFAKRKIKKVINTETKHFCFAMQNKELSLIIYSTLFTQNKPETIKLKRGSDCEFISGEQFDFLISIENDTIKLSENKTVNQIGNFILHADK